MSRGEVAVTRLAGAAVRIDGRAIPLHSIWTTDWEVPAVIWPVPRCRRESFLAADKRRRPCTISNADATPPRSWLSSSRRRWAGFALRQPQPELHPDVSFMESMIPHRSICEAAGRQVDVTGWHWCIGWGLILPADPAG